MNFLIFFCSIVYCAVYRQGDRGTNWYFILNGQVSLACSPSSIAATASPNHYVSFFFVQFVEAVEGG